MNRGHYWGRQGYGQLFRGDSENIAPDGYTSATTPKGGKLAGWVMGASAASKQLGVAA